MIERFAGNAHGGMTMQAALIFGGVGLVLALIGPMIMESATQRMASVRGSGIDTTTTGSIGQPQRYTIRKSVLSDRPQILCGVRISKACLPDN